MGSGLVKGMGKVCGVSEGRESSTSGKERRGMGEITVRDQR